MVLGGKTNRRSSNFLKVENDDESVDPNFVDARVDPVSKVPIIKSSKWDLFKNWSQMA